MAPIRAAMRLVLATLVFAVLGWHQAAAERRVALVVGDGAYVHVPRLDNPANDAKLIASTLEQLGFTLIGGAAQLDLDRLSLERVIREFGRAIGPGTVALFYYSGHGVQIRGNNYLVPVQADLASASDVDFELLDVDIVVRQMDAAHSSLNLIILDACRNNPFGGRGLRDSGGGLAEMRAPRGTLISYATQPGGVAKDGVPGGDSPYSVALAKALKVPGIDVFKAFNLVGLQVSESTGGSQVPWLASSPIEGEFYLASAPAAQPPPPAPPPAQPPAAQPLFADRDALFWHSIEATNRPEELEAYIHKFPDGTFSDLARMRLALLQAPHPAPAAAPPEVPAPISPPTSSPTPPQPPPQPDVRIGRDQIREAQRLLAAMGLSRAPVSNQPGDHLAAAIRIFQRAAGLSESGTLTPALLDALRGPPPAAAARAGALFAFAAEAMRGGRSAEAAVLYEEGLQLKPDSPDAAHALAELRKPRETAPPPRIVQRPAEPPAASRQASAPVERAPASGVSATAVDGQGRRFRSNAATEGAAVNGALQMCHASAAGECRIVSLTGSAE